MRCCRSLFLAFGSSPEHSRISLKQQASDFATQAIQLAQQSLTIPEPIVIPSSVDTFGVIAPSVVINPAPQIKSLPPVDIDFANPSPEAVAYFYDIPSKECSNKSINSTIFSLSC